MTEQRLSDAIGYILDTFKYQRPSVADIIGYDRRIRLYSHNEVCELVMKGERFSDFEKHWIGETLFRIRKTDCEKYRYKPNTQNPNEHP